MMIHIDMNDETKKRVDDLVEETGWTKKATILFLIKKGFEQIKEDKKNTEEKMLWTKK